MGLKGRVNSRLSIREKLFLFFSPPSFFWYFQPDCTFVIGKNVIQQKEMTRMKKDDIITLPTGEKVKVVNADPTKYKNIILIERDNLERRVIDREKMEIMKAPRL